MIEQAHGLGVHTDGPPVISYAQNAEDVRLWRVFSRQPSGVYVDVGAGDPVLHSVTKLFYDAGWAGMNVEPGPAFKQLVRARPRDVNVDVAVRSQEGEATLWVSSPDPGLSSFDPPPGHLVPAGFSFTPKRVKCVRLESLIEEHLGDRSVDFLKVDVERAEREVLSSFDLAIVRPTVILVEAISPLENQPSHAEWEPLLNENDYVLAAFDGLNRFYVPVERADLVDALAYPISVLDRYETHRAASLERENASLRAENDVRRERIGRLEAENAVLAAKADTATDHIEAMQATLSWRITRPLRSLRRLQRSAASGPPRLRGSRPQRPGRRDLEAALARRVAKAVEVLHPDGLPGGQLGLESSLDLLEEALELGSPPDRAKAWISLVAADASFPGERSVERLARRLRMDGTRGVRYEVVARFEDALERGSATSAELDIRRDRVVVDVTHTISNDLHTGIQRVVRETVSRWINAGYPIDLVHFDFATHSLRLLSHDEYERMTRWREHLGRTGAEMTTRLPDEATGDALVPWGSRLVLPELVAEPERCSAYRVLASASVLQSLSLIAFDLIPIVAAETVTDWIAGTFPAYLSVVKRADRVSAISRTSADGFRAFGRMVASEGLPGPHVVAHPLPAEPPLLDPATLETARRTLGIDRDPLILVVGSHEPRKNHVALLEAAERLWRGGTAFQMLFLGGSGWKSEAFDELVDHLVSSGRPIDVRRRCSEDELWAAYSLARFTVFPSLLEGFGLPVVESLAVGTPVIASAHGSTAEIVEGGGCLAVDPRDVDSLQHAMSRLLGDDDLLERLRREALERPRWTWDDYAAGVWNFVLGQASS